MITASGRPKFKLSPIASFMDYERFAIFLRRIPAAALRDNYWRHLATYRNFDINFPNLNIIFIHRRRFTFRRGLVTLFLHHKYDTIFAVFC